MKVTSLSKLLICLTFTLSLTACTTNDSKSSLISLDILQDMVLDFSVKALHMLIDPESASPFSEPKIEVDCISDKEHRDCCIATGTMDVEVPLPDFSDRIRDELLNDIKAAFLKFEILMGKEPELPGDMDWLIQLNDKIAWKLLKEWFDLNPKLRAIFERRVLTPEECQQILKGEIDQRFPGAFKEYYQDMLVPTQIPSPQPMVWPACHIVPDIPYYHIECPP